MRIPLSTYRIQFHEGFTFDDAARIAPYLARLGISHAYLSPVLQATPGSTHGYDAVDPTRLDAARGGPEAFARLQTALADAGVDIVLDIVPNHLATTLPENRWWWDVLENGPLARWADAFDVDWAFGGDANDNRVLLPVLGDHYGRALENNELRITRDGPRFEVAYFDNRFPVSPRTLDGLFAAAARRLPTGRSREDLQFLADASAVLPHAMRPSYEAAERRARGALAIRRTLADLIARDGAVADAIDGEIDRLNADHDALDTLLERQNYRLAFWRLAGSELNYRRFFDINTLIGVRVEDERIFDATHELILGLVEARKADNGAAPGKAAAVHGLRIDHPDGLRDPGAYFADLARRAPSAWILAEKILEPGEPLRSAWPIAGTTGYDFLNLAQNVLIDPAAEEPLTRLYHEFTGETEAYEDLVYARKLAVTRELLGGDVARLVELLLVIFRPRRRLRDFTRPQLRRALETLAACFPVYRTYVRAAVGEVHPTDERYVREAVARAKERDETIDHELLDFLASLLLLRTPPAASPSTADEPVPEHEFVMGFQQLTGPVMAKGVEDTAFYRFNRFIALNEVGGDPGHFTASPAAFHEQCRERVRQWPHAMLASSTHDTKRSEDVRARLAALSEIPEEWGDAVRRWSQMNEPRRAPSGGGGGGGGSGDGGAELDRNAEYLFYQTVVGAWPIDADRAAAFMLKAAKEAKAHTSWVEPDEAYEEALDRFARASLADQTFTEDVARFVDRVKPLGWTNSLAQILLKLTAPGVPDTYQGCELWDLSLVDPDNRRPVDYALRARLLDEVDALSPEQIWSRMEEGLPKLFTIRQALALRRAFPEALRGDAPYEPLHAVGARADHALAFLRGPGDEQVITIVPRLTARLRGADGPIDWGDTAVDLPAGHWRDHLSGLSHEGGPVRLADLLKIAPIALLARTP